jgi:hypothetical protein
MDFNKTLKKLGISANFSVNEKAPMFFYTAFKEGEELLFVKRDRKKWKVIMDLDWFTERFKNA